MSECLKWRFMVKFINILFCIIIFSIDTLSQDVSTSITINITHKKDQIGEPYGVGALYGFDDSIYVYLPSDGCIRVHNRDGRYCYSVYLETVGRNSYHGDDFIYYNSKFYFLNSVDKRVEVFSQSGEYCKECAIPYDNFDEGSLQKRFITRIYSHNNQIYVGNDYCVSSFYNLVTEENLLQKKRCFQSKLSYFGEKILFKKDLFVQKEKSYSSIDGKNILDIGGKMYFGYTTKNKLILELMR